MKNKHLRNDILLVAALLIFATIGGVYLFFFRESGSSVEVTIDGKLYGTYSLSQNRVEDIITGDAGSQLNRLVISDGKAFVETATCPDGICSDHRAVFRNGESIICLPHKLVITVVSKKSADAPDVVA